MPKITHVLIERRSGRREVIPVAILDCQWLGDDRKRILVAAIRSGRTVATGMCYYSPLASADPIEGRIEKVGHVVSASDTAPKYRTEGYRP